MSRSAAEGGLNRRDFVSRALTLGGLMAAANVARPSYVWGAVSHRPLDPVNPDILFGSTSSLWSGARDLEWAIKRMAALGLQGIEPYAAQIEKYRGNPLVLKKLFDDAGITMIDVSNGAKGQSTNFIDPEHTPKTIADHVAFARDFLQPFGCTLWKCNMGARPAGAQATISSSAWPTPSMRSDVRPLPWGSAWRRTRTSGDQSSASTKSAR